MKIEKLPSGSYRIRKTINKKTYTFVFDHKPGDKEINEKLFDVYNENATGCDMTFEKAAKEYIEMKRNVLSPRTIKEYAETPRRLSEAFNKKIIKDITQIDIQQEINRLSLDKSAKTVRNYHGFISAVLGTYKPELKICTTLPKKRKNEPYIPTDDDVKRLIEYAQTSCNGRYYVAIVLGCYGVSRSEICALTADDVKGNTISINKGKVLNDSNEWIIKDIPKTTARIRTIPVPNDVVKIIKEQGYAYDGHPNDISDFINDACKALNIEHFSLHKLRHYFASKLSSENIDVETILAFGGWETDFVMKNIYRHKMDSKVKEASNKLGTLLFS